MVSFVAVVGIILIITVKRSAVHVIQFVAASIYVLIDSASNQKLTEREQ